MKIIISRKGFDSSYGGAASPILPDGTLLSLPIPLESHISYGELHVNGHSLGRIVEDLTRGQITGRHGAHLDPDLTACAYPRRPGWRSLFGQVGAAQSHLARSGVDIGDLFLFFGWFRQTEVVSGRYRFPHSDAERAYRAAMGHWNDYVDWRRHRNPARAELEAHYGYDTKHAMHLFRLLRMGEEILRDGIVRVLRPDAEWLLDVRDGALSYEQVIQMAAEHEARLGTLIEHSALPLEPDSMTAERLVVELQEEFLFGRR